MDERAPMLLSRWFALYALATLVGAGFLYRWGIAVGSQGIIIAGGVVLAVFALALSKGVVTLIGYVLGLKRLKRK